MFLDGPATTGAVTVTTSAIEAKVGGTVLSERKSLAIQPIDYDIEWSYSSGFSLGTGHIIYAGTLIYVQTGETLPVYLRAAQNTDVRLSEIS